MEVHQLVWLRHSLGLLRRHGPEYGIRSPEDPRRFRTASLAQLRMLAQKAGAAKLTRLALRTSVLAAAAAIDCLSAMLRAKVSRPPSSHTCCSSSSLSPDSTCARGSQFCVIVRKLLTNNQHRRSVQAVYAQHLLHAVVAHMGPAKCIQGSQPATLLRCGREKRRRWGAGWLVSCPAARWTRTPAFHGVTSESLHTTPLLRR